MCCCKKLSSIDVLSITPRIPIRAGIQEGPAAMNKGQAAQNRIFPSDTGWRMVWYSPVMTRLVSSNAMALVKPCSRSKYPFTEKKPAATNRVPPSAISQTSGRVPRKTNSRTGPTNVSQSGTRISQTVQSPHPLRILFSGLVRTICSLSFNPAKRSA